MPNDNLDLNPEDQALLSALAIQDPNAEGEAPPEDYGEWNERLPLSLQSCMMGLAEEVCEEFKYPRRLEVMSAWKARSFWREMQHLTWNWEGECWDVLGPAAGNGRDAKKDSAVLYSTNIYQGFGESFIAVVTQSVPSVRFEPEDPEDPADIETAKECEPLRRYVQHENDPIKLMTKAAYLSWTDGRIHGWTRWETDKRTGKPREMQTVYGVMEVKVPVIYNEQSEYPYLQFSREYHTTEVRAMVKARSFEDPNYYKKVKGGASGKGNDTYERTARISVMQGVGFKSAGSDTYANLVTIQRTWLRPSCFLSDKVEVDLVEQLDTLFPNGCYVESANGVYIGSRNANMDDEWTVENIMEGDGAYRNAKGTCLLSVQERANDIINVTQDVYEKTQPGSHWDDKLFDVDAMNRQRSMPGARYGVNVDELTPGDSLTAHVFYEPAASVSADMLTYLKSLISEVPEFLTGISSILFGGDEGGDSSGRALSIQQAAAMGRIGLPFRVMKRFYARMMEQAVRCASRNRTSDLRVGLPDDMGKVESIKVRIEALNGNVRCYPDTDENYPESFSAKRNTYMKLMEEGNSDPVMHAILSNPRNQVLAKKYIGLTDLVLPDADSWDKQEAEISILLVEPPTVGQLNVPNPVTMQPETLEVPQSSLPIDVDYDNHEAEFLTVVLFCNSAKGQEAKKANQMGFENVRLHGLLHRAELVKKMQQEAMAQAAAGAPAGKEPGQASPPKDTKQESAPALGGPAPGGAA